MTAQHLLNIHKPVFVHHADTLLAMNYPTAKITRRPILVQGRIHIGYRYKIATGLFKWETAEVHGAMQTAKP